jgi:hypothetical protein
MLIERAFDSRTLANMNVALDRVYGNGQQMLVSNNVGCCGPLRNNLRLVDPRKGARHEEDPAKV